MEETFKESIIEKITQIEKQLVPLSKNATAGDEIKEQQKSLLMTITTLKSCLSQLKSNARTILNTSGRMSSLSGKLERCTHALENPVEKKEHHIHHFRWPLGVAVAVFLLLALAVSRLYFNHQKLQQYIANDTKYRSLKLMKNKEMRELLDWADSTYKANPNMRKQVEQQEKAQKRKQELLQQAREKQQEAEKLKRKAGKVANQLTSHPSDRIVFSYGPKKIS